MSHYFQELGRLQHSCGHTQSHISPGLTCFRHIHCFRYSDCSGPAAGLILTHPIPPIATTYRTGLIWSQFRQWLLRKQHTAWVRDIRRFLAEIFMHLQLTGCWSMLFQDWNPQTLGIWIWIWIWKVIGKLPEGISRRWRWKAELRKTMLECIDGRK